MLTFPRRVTGRTKGSQGRLIDCGCCGSDYVNPVASRVQGDWGWWIRLRCGECGSVREVEVTNDEAARYDAALDRGMAKIAAAVAKLDRERMNAVLLAALDRDLRDPGDFGR